MLKPHTQIPQLNCHCIGCAWMRAASHWEAANREGKLHSRRLGLALRTEREAAGKSLRSVARRLELSATYISDIEIGRVTLPKRALINRIRAAIKTAK